MPSLKEPQKSIPGGFVFLQPETGWTPVPFSSLDSIVQQLIKHRQGQPYLMAKNSWSVDPAVVYQEVMHYNVCKCQQMGWTDYLLGGSEAIVPFQHTPPSLLQKAKRLAAGGETILQWIASGAEAVAQELAEKRAGICVACPFNGQGGIESYFTVPAQTAIRKTLERKRDMKLATAQDEKLGVCTACDCPLRLKVWLPLENILGRMKPETLAALHENCWIRNKDA